MLLVFYRLPLPWYRGADFDLPMLYNVGLLASVLSGMIFLALYAWRLAKEARQMADALAATEMVLAREQQLHALDGLAAAAAHELGTPLSTIAVVAKELNRDAAQGSQFAEDLALLQSQAVRCREILKKLTRGPTEPDPLHARMSITQLIEEAAGPYRGFGAELVMTASPEPGSEGAALHEPVGERRPGVLYGLGNLVENAVDFARERVEIAARWSARHVVIEIADDGSGRVRRRHGCPGRALHHHPPGAAPWSDKGWRTLRPGPRLLHRQDPAGALRRHRHAGQPPVAGSRRDREDQLAARGFREKAGDDAGRRRPSVSACSGRMRMAAFINKPVVLGCIR